MPTWYATSSLVSVHQEMSETDPGTEAFASPVTGWIVGTGGTGTAPFNSQTEQASGTFTGGPHPDGSIDTSGGDCLRTTNAYSGSFASGNWTVNFCVRSNTVVAGQGRVTVRLFRGANADGSGATQITAAIQNGSTITSSTSTTTNSTIAFNPGAFSVDNEFIFVQLGWERISAGGMSTSDINMRIGNSASLGTRVVSSTFSPILSGTLTIAGSSTVAFIGEAVLPPTPPVHPTLTTFTPVIFSRTTLYQTSFDPPLGPVFVSGQLAIAGSTTVAWVGSQAAAPFDLATINTVVTFSQTRLYPTLFEPPPQLAAPVSGTLAIAGSSTLAFIGSSVLAGAFSTAGSTTVAWTGRSIAATTLTISGSTTVAWNGVTVTVGSFSIAGSSEPLWVGQSTAQATLSVDLGTAVAWVGSFVSTGSGALIVQGSTDVVWIGRATAQGTLSIAGSTTVAWSGVAIKPTTLTIAGSTDVSWVGRAISRGTLTISGSTTVAWIGSAVKPTTLSITTGTTNVSWVGRATAQGTLSISLGTAVAWVGVGSVAGSGTMVVSGSTTVAWTGRAVAQGALSISGSTTAAFTGASIAQATLSISGSTTVAWSGASIREAAAVMAGSTTVAWIGASLVTPSQFTIGGSTDITWIGVALEIRSGIFQISGSSDLTFIGMGALPPEPGQFSIGGSTEVLFIGENATTFVLPPEGYESQVGVWHVRPAPIGSRRRWSGRTGKRYRIYGTIPAPSVPQVPLWILDDGYWHDGGVWIDTEVWED